MDVGAWPVSDRLGLPLFGESGSTLVIGGGRRICILGCSYLGGIVGQEPGSEASRVSQRLSKRQMGLSLPGDKRP
jgi:hypothetical protein